MPAATCHPGQDSSVAFAKGPVVLRPVSGNFGTGGNVRLIAPSGDCDITPPPGVWSQDRIVAFIPQENPGNRADGQPFQIEITVTSPQTATYLAEDVYITGPQDWDWPDPPMHLFAPHGGTVVKVPLPEGITEEDLVSRTNAGV